jgi:tetratricopeptide (TPR) repeat protein
MKSALVLAPNTNLLSAKHLCRLWPSKYGLITCLIVEVVFLALISPHIDGFNKTTFFYIPGFIFVCLVSWLSTACYWLYSNRIPKTEKGKFGFVVSIYCDDYETDKKFRADFVNNLNVLITDGSTGKYFNFIELSNHVAKDISNPQDAQLILEKTKGHFIIHGRVKTRDKIHYFELNSIVTHKPLPIVVSNELKKEMSELLPRKIRIADNNFLESFEFTSKWAEIASKYLIGNARLLSGDIGPALELYNEVLNVSKNYENIPVINELRSKSIKNIVVILDIRATSLYEKWVETHDISLIEHIRPLLDEYDKYNICNYQIETIKSISLVLLSKDIDSAIKILSIFPKDIQNATWMLNKAFLFAYKGDLNTAYREYSRALKRPVNEFSDGLINKVEDFILLIIEQNPKVPQLYYCLGIINKDFKEDLLLAKRDFETFISYSPINTFTKEKEIANRWVNEIAT